MTSPTWNISIKDGRPVARQTIRGLDPQKLADDLETAYKAKATNLVEKVNEYKDKKIPAVTTLKTKTDALQESLQKLTNTLDIFSTSTNLFREKGVSYQKQDSAVSLAVNSTASISNDAFKISVLQMATCDMKKSSLDNLFPDPTAGLTLSGTLKINGTSIAITDGSEESTNMSLENIMAAVNAVSDQTNVVASTVKLNDDQYRFVLIATGLATPIDLSETDQTISDGYIF
ncbi:MAG: flagellar cap protein FliD N-terminal domain-containing protein [Alphaproteobacteria bacterium]